MTDFVIEAMGPDGKKQKYEIKDVPDIETAQTQLKAFRLQEVKEKQAAEIEASPAWTKPFVATHDLGRGSLDALTLGGLSRAGDYLAGDDSVSMSTQAAKDRAGWAGTALDVATAAKYLPTMVPRAVGAIGGGPGVRAITAGGTAAGEGAAMGATSAAMHDQDVPTGAGIGGVTGILGQAVGGAVNAGKRKFDEVFRGKTFEAPAYNIKQLPKNATPQQQVNYAAAEAERQAAKHVDNPLAKQKAAINEFSELPTRSGYDRNFNTAEREQVQRIIKGDPGTNIARRAGDFTTNPFFLGSIGAAGGIPGVLAAGAMGTAGGQLKKMSSAGTEEAVRDMRRMMYPNIDKFKGPISPEWIKRMRHGSRQAVEEELGY